MHRLGHALVCVCLLGCGAADPVDETAEETVDPSGAGGGAAGGSRATGGAREGGSGGARDGGSGGAREGGSGGASGSGTGGATGGVGGSVTLPEAGSACAGTPPALEPGVWKDISPPVDISGTFGMTTFAIDPKNTCTLYLSVNQRGMWKTIDGGSTWARLGSPPSAPNYGTTTDYLDSPVAVRVDPSDSQHLYCTQGVRGATQGFWVSRDAGNTWQQPAGFIEAVKTIGTVDMTTLAIDKADFRHALVGSHSWWKGLSNGGILETKDGGETFIIHQPVSSWPGGSIGIQFLYDPPTQKGDPSTWMVNTDGMQSFWRTTDAGATWTNLTGNYNGLHGGAALYYAKTGVIYSGASQYPLRSTDNGVTWQNLSSAGLSYSQYMTIIGDGNLLYTAPSCACGGSPYNTPMMVSPETDGLTWTQYEGGAQKFGNGPSALGFDPVRRILYSANWLTGFWALKVKP